MTIGLLIHEIGFNDSFYIEMSLKTETAHHFADHIISSDKKAFRKEGWPDNEIQTSFESLMSIKNIEDFVLDDELSNLNIHVFKILNKTIALFCM